MSICLVKQARQLHKSGCDHRASSPSVILRIGRNVEIERADERGFEESPERIFMPMKSAGGVYTSYGAQCSLSRAAKSTRNIPSIAAKGDRLHVLSRG